MKNQLHEDKWKTARLNLLNLARSGGLGETDAASPAQSPGMNGLEHMMYGHADLLRQDDAVNIHEQ